MIAVHGNEKDFVDRDGTKIITAKVGFIVLAA
jgi:hypothetical protein